MTIKEQLKYMINVNRRVAEMILPDITEDESLATVDKIPNHIRWLTGHIACTHAFALSKLGKTEKEWDDLEELFSSGKELASDPSVYPSMADLRGMLSDIHDRTLDLIENIDESALAQEVGEGDQKRAVWQRMVFYQMHEFYHAGQIVHIRRAIGRERPFG